MADDIAARLREEVRTFALYPQPGADAMAVAVSAAKVDALLAWLTPALPMLLDTVRELDGPFEVSTKLHGGLDPEELDFHVTAALFVLVARLVDNGMIQIPPTP